MLVEGLREGDLKWLVSNYVSVDQYTSKLDDDNITVAFFINERDAAIDLRNFIEKVFYIEIRDIEVSDTMTNDNKYILFVEFERNINFPKILLDMIEAVNHVTGNTEWKFKTFGMDDKADLTVDNIRKHVRLTKYRHNLSDETSEENLEPSEENGEENSSEESSERVEESFVPTIRYFGKKREYIPEGYITEEEFNKLVEESGTLNSRDNYEQYLLENQYPEYQVITTDSNLFLVKGNKILKFK